MMMWNLSQESMVGLISKKAINIIHCIHRLNKNYTNISVYAEIAKTVFVMKTFNQLKQKGTSSACKGQLQKNPNIIT